MKILKTTLVSIALISMLSACSKPDITGTWIPEKTDSSDRTYTYYEIKKTDGEDRYLFVKKKYSIRPFFKGDKVPSLLMDTSKVLSFTKDNTYCVEGSLNSECVVMTDSNKIAVYNEGNFKKSASNTHKIPVNE